MRGFKKLLILLCTMMMVLGMVTAVQAAPATVTGLRASAGEGKVTLKWNKVKGAKGYNVYRAVGNSTPVKVKRLKKNKVTLTKQNNGTTYTYYVSAYDKSGEGVKSTGATATPTMAGLTAPSIKVTWSAANAVELKWNKIKKASGYEVFLVENGQYRKLGNSKDAGYYAEGLSEETTYNFVVRSYRKKGKSSYYGTYSNMVTATTTKVEEYQSSSQVSPDGSIFGVHPYRWKGQMRGTLTLKSVNGTVTTIKKGAKVTVTQKGKQRVTFEYNGTYYTTARSNVKMYGLIWKKNAYGDSVARTFPNKAGYTSPTNWLIWLSTYSQRVFIYKGSAGHWVLQRSFNCCTGLFGMETGVGKTRISGKSYTWWWNGLFSAYYASHISTGAFHSWPGGFGRPASHGCVRCPMNQAKFIYNNVPKNTTVYLW